MLSPPDPLHDVCFALRRPFLCAQVTAQDAWLFVCQGYEPTQPCLRCLPPLDDAAGELSPFAEAAGALLGSLLATEALKLILGIGTPLIGKLLLYDALAGTFDYVRLKKNPDCKVCSDHPEVTELIDYEAFCGVPGHDRAESRLPSEWEIEPTVLAERLRKGDPIRIIDVREPHELEISRLEGAELIPLGELPSRMHELDSAQEIVFLCTMGSRSARAVELMATAGFRKVKNLRGGINAWARQVDPRLPVY